MLVERPRDLLRVRLRRSAGLVGWHQLGEAAVDANGDFKIEWDGTYADERDLPHDQAGEGDTHRRTVPLEVSTGALIYRPTIDIEIPCAEVTAPAPDLLAEIDLDPDMPTYDDVAFRVRGAVSNVGGEASGPFKAVLYFVNEGAPGGGSWTAVRTVQSEGLAPRESLMIEHQQPALPAGTYRFCMVADQGEEVAEASESNNAAWWRFAIRERWLIAPTSWLRYTPGAGTTAIGDPSRRAMGAAGASRTSSRRSSVSPTSGSPTSRRRSAASSG